MSTESLLRWLEQKTSQEKESRTLKMEHLLVLPNYPRLGLVERGQQAATQAPTHRSQTHFVASHAAQWSAPARSVDFHCG